MLYTHTHTTGMIHIYATPIQKLIQNGNLIPKKEKKNRSNLIPRALGPFTHTQLALIAKGKGQGFCVGDR